MRSLTCNGRRFAMRKEKINGRQRAALVRVSLPPLPRYHHIGLPSAAFGEDQLFTPIEHWRFGASDDRRLALDALAIHAVELRSARASEGC
jgi:hypothetical protein